MTSPGLATNGMDHCGLGNHYLYTRVSVPISVRSCLCKCKRVVAVRRSFRRWKIRQSDYWRMVVSVLY